MNLFGEGPAYVPGFTYQPGFITRQEEEELLGHIRALTLTNMMFHGYEAKRKTLSLGYDYNFDSRRIKKGTDIPAFMGTVIERVALTLSVPPAEIAEVLVTEYPPGSVINWHRDAPPFESIAGLSLLSDCIFRLRPYAKLLRTRKSTFAYDIRRRSLYLIQGEARTEWEHSTQPVTGTRYSLTFRTLVNKKA